MLYRKSVLAMLLALIFLSFFGTLGLSASMFPENYDWRYRVISNLLSPRDNPNYRWLPACGISVAAVLILSTIVQGTGHGEFHDEPAAGDVFSGPCPIG